MKLSFYKAWSKTQAMHAHGSIQDEANTLWKGTPILEGHEKKQMRRQNGKKRAYRSLRQSMQHVWVLEPAASSDGCKNRPAPEEEGNS